MSPGPYAFVVEVHGALDHDAHTVQGVNPYREVLAFTYGFIHVYGFPGGGPDTYFLSLCLLTLDHVGHPYLGLILLGVLYAEVGLEVFPGGPFREVESRGQGLSAPDLYAGIVVL